MKKSVILISGLILLISCTNKNSNNTEQNDNDVYERLKKNGIELIEPGPPENNYVYSVRSGNFVFMSGHGPNVPGKNIERGKKGKLGTDLTIEEGQEAARHTANSLLSSLHQEIGDLNKVKRIVKVTGMVNADPEFTQHSKVINGFSDLMVDVFGKRGKHARSAVGMSSLPGNIPVEIQMIVELEK